jgi:hypothetical protein
MHAVILASDGAEQRQVGGELFADAPIFGRHREKLFSTARIRGAHAIRLAWTPALAEQRRQRRSGAVTMSLTLRR